MRQSLRSTGRAISGSPPLERLQRDSRCGSLMLPRTVELRVDRRGGEYLCEADEREETIES